MQPYRSTLLTLVRTISKEARKPTQYGPHPPFQHSPQGTAIVSRFLLLSMLLVDISTKAGQHNKSCHYKLLY